MSKIDFKPNFYDVPFFYDGIGSDEWITENCYLCIWIAERSEGRDPGKYIPLRKQLELGLIDRIPEKYKAYCLNPDWDAYLYEDARKNEGEDKAK